MPINVDKDIRDDLDIIIGCLREIQVQLWQQSLETHQDAIKQMEELDVIEKTVKMFHEGSHEKACKNRTERELKYMK